MFHNETMPVLLDEQTQVATSYRVGIDPPAGPAKSNRAERTRDRNTRNRSRDSAMRSGERSRFLLPARTVAGGRQRSPCMKGSRVPRRSEERRVGKECRS